MKLKLRFASVTASTFIEYLFSRDELTPALNFPNGISPKYISPAAARRFALHSKKITLPPLARNNFSRQNSKNKELEARPKFREKLSSPRIPRALAERNPGATKSARGGKKNLQPSNPRV